MTQKFTTRSIFSFFLVFGLLLIQSCGNESVEVTPVNSNDTDADGVMNTVDNCASISNPDQVDTDKDGLGDACDDDDDNDGIPDVEDNCPLTVNPDQADTDNDGIGNVCDPDYVDPNTPTALCENGFAGAYPCKDYDLMAQVSLADLNATAGNDCWGWTDTTTGKEYALMGTNANVSFVDISTPNNPKVLGFLPTATVNSPWRDIKVYNNYAFIVSEAASHGMQVFDLTRLRDVQNPPQTFTADLDFTAFGSAHNMVINESSGYAYPVGENRNSTYGGGPLFINIQDPMNPILEGGFAAGGYSHDGEVVTYHGPDTDYTGQEIFVGSNENEVVIANFTDKNNPVLISRISYNQVQYAHQGWFTDDQRYFILGDELDEYYLGNNTKTIIFDFTDLDNPKVHFNYFGNIMAIDHNGYVKNNTFYQACYRAGVRMIDISQIVDKSFTEVGYFDTYPADDNPEFNGVWNVYPYFPSGNIILSDIEKGLFIIRKSGT